MTPSRTIPAALCAAALLLSTGCGGSEDDDAPRAWIADTYEREDGYTDVYRDPADPPLDVADEIEGERRAEDRITDDGMVFLLYDDDIVAVGPGEVTSTRSSLISVDDYDDARARYREQIGNRWPASQSDSGGDFRGGGPGSGK